MTKLHALLGKNILKGPYFGIEIEAEGEGMSVIHHEWWHSEDDGSLRGLFPNQRHEFVSSPLSLENVDPALDVLIDSQKEAKIDFSFRTSSHVHVNCLDMDDQEIGAFIYTYFLLEKDLMKYCGEHRNNNRFCLRMVDSDVLTDILKTLVDVRFRDIRVFVNDDMRYGACNMASLCKYGTLEFRGMRGTLDKEVLMNWVGALNRIREYAIEKGSAWDVYTEAVNDSDGFAKAVLKEFTNVFINPGSRFNIAEALSLTVEIPFAAKFIKAQAEVKEERVRARPVAAKRAMEMFDANLIADLMNERNPVDGQIRPVAF